MGLVVGRQCTTVFSILASKTTPQLLAKRFYVGSSPTSTQQKISALRAALMSPTTRPSRGGDFRRNFIGENGEPCSRNLEAKGASQSNLYRAPRVLKACSFLKHPKTLPCRGWKTQVFPKSEPKKRAQKAKRCKRAKPKEAGKQNKKSFSVPWGSWRLCRKVCNVSTAPMIGEKKSKKNEEVVKSGNRGN